MRRLVLVALASTFTACGPSVVTHPKDRQHALKVKQAMKIYEIRLKRADLPLVPFESSVRPWQIGAEVIAAYQVPKENTEIFLVYTPHTDVELETFFSTVHLGELLGKYSSGPVQIFTRRDWPITSGSWALSDLLSGVFGLCPSAMKAGTQLEDYARTLEDPAEVLAFTEALLDTSRFHLMPHAMPAEVSWLKPDLARGLREVEHGAEALLMYFSTPEKLQTAVDRIQHTGWPQKAEYRLARRGLVLLFLWAPRHHRSRFFKSMLKAFSGQCRLPIEHKKGCHDPCTVCQGQPMKAPWHRCQAPIWDDDPRPPAPPEFD